MEWRSKFEDEAITIQKNSDRSSFSFLNTALLFHCDEIYEDSREWSGFGSPRCEAAQDVVKRLKSEFGPTLGERMMNAAFVYRVMSVTSPSAMASG